MDMKSNIVLICFYDEICVIDLTGNVLFWRDDINYLTKEEANTGFLRIIGLGCDFISHIGNSEDFVQDALTELKLKTKLLKQAQIEKNDKLKNVNKESFYNMVWEEDPLNNPYKGE